VRWETRDHKKRVERALENRRSASDAYHWNQKMEAGLKRMERNLGRPSSIGALLVLAEPMPGTVTMTDSTDGSLFPVNRMFQMWRR
jgi:hypothetical protein